MHMLLSGKGAAMENIEGRIVSKTKKFCVFLLVVVVLLHAAASSQHVISAML